MVDSGQELAVNLLGHFSRNGRRGGWAGKTDPPTFKGIGYFNPNDRTIFRLCFNIMNHQLLHLFYSLALISRRHKPGKSGLMSHYNAILRKKKRAYLTSRKF